MYTDRVTIQVYGKIKGPSGINLKAGQVVVLEDSPYVRILLKSGSVSLIDPPSLDVEYLHKAGLLRKGEVYVPPVKEEPKVEKPKVEEDKTILVRKPRLVDVPRPDKKISEKVEESPEEKLEEIAEPVSENNKEEVESKESE